jgi:uncharacterized protein (TIGR02001 family)
MRVVLAFAAGALALACALPSAAAELDFSVNAALATDYVFRGVSQTDGQMTAQGGADVAYGIGYAGVWASGVDFGDGTDAEIDVYGGAKPSYGGFNFDVGFIYYGYAGQPAGSPWDYWEAKAAASHAVGPGTVGVAAFYSPEFTGKTGDAVYVELNGSVPVPGAEQLSVSGAIGHQEIDLAPGYTTWNLGATFAVSDNLSLDVRYWDTDAHDLGPIYDSRFVGTLKAVF